MVIRTVAALLSLLAMSVAAQAATVIVPYAGSFDEATVAASGGLPAGDYDTIGGLPDVGQFNLIAGDNTFAGSIWTPGDSSDAFVIGIGSGLTLTGASIRFGTNLTPFAPMFAFPAPHWTLEESSPTPTIFDQQVGYDGLGSTQTVTAPSFSRGAGLYSLTIGNGTFGINAGDFTTPIDYEMTFTVAGPTSVPTVSSLALFVAALGGLTAVGVARRRGAQAVPRR